MRRALVLAAMALLAGTRAWAQPMDVTSYSLLAQDEIRARNLDVLSGNVGVNDLGGELVATNQFLAPQSVVVASTVRFRDEAVCDALFAFSATGDDSACGPAIIPQLPITEDLAGSCGFPVSPPACDPNQPVHLRPNEGRLVLPPGTYGDLLITGNGSQTGTIELTGGSYVFCNVTIARNGRLEFDAPSTVFVTGDVNAVSNGGEVEPAPGSGLSATDVNLIVAGEKVRFSKYTVVRLLLCAPNALLELAGGSELTGRFVAERVKAFGATITGVGGGPTTTTTTLVPVSTTSTSTSTTIAGQVCGNGIREGSEQCDLSDLGGATCPGSSPGGAFPACTENCLLDFSSCPSVTTTSTTLATTTTVLVTTTSTVLVTTTSTTIVAQVCGNGVREGTEQCDMSDLGGATCPGSSPDGAFPTCTGDCMLDFSSCPPLPTTTTTVSPASTTSTTTPPASTTSTTAPPASTTSTTAPPTSTTSTSTSSTSTTSSTATSTSTTSTSTSTTSTTFPTGTILRFTTGSLAEDCGVAKSGGATGTVVKTLSCGGLNLGHGSGTVPEGPTPAGADTFFNTACTGTDCTVTARTAAETGSSNNCSDTGCDFGPFLPIANPGTPALSTCVHNTFATPGTGTLDAATGEFDGSVPLSSQTTVTGNVSNPCPKCLGGTPGVAGSGTCDATWVAAGSVASPDSGNACTPTNATGDTYDCRPPQAPYSGVLAPFPVTLSPLATGPSTLVGSTPCPDQTTAGCFGQPTCDYIEEDGAPAGPLGTTPQPAILASAFCIPATGNVLVDGSAGLPGPGATSLPGTLNFLP